MNLSIKLGPLSFSMGKSLSPDAQAWIRGDDVDDSASGNGARLVMPYAQSAWVYIAVSTLAENISKIPFRISRVGSGKARKVRALRGSSDHKARAFARRALGENIIESGPCVDLFERPHPTMDKRLFWEQVVTWAGLRGEFFIAPMDDADQPVDLSDRSPRIKRMIALEPDLFWHMVIGYELVAWRYTGSPLMTPISSQILNPSEVIHSRNVNPYLYWRGMSPLSVAMLAAGSDYAAEKFQKGLLVNNADTGLIVTTEQNPQQDQREQIVSALRERKRKAGTPDRPLFLWGGAKVEKPTISNVDMEFLSNRKFTRQEIFGIFKVPESVAGFSDAKSTSLSGGGQAMNAEKLTFVEQELSYLAERIESAVAPIIATFGDDLVGFFDIESLPVMQEARRMRWDTATKAFNLGVPMDTINTTFDLGLPNLPHGKKSYLPFSLQEVGADDSGAMPAEGVEDETAKEEAEKQNPFSRMLKLLGAAEHKDQGVESDGGFSFPGCCNHGMSNMLGGQLRSRPKSEISLWRSHAAKRKVVIKTFDAKFNKILFEARAETLRKIEARYSPANHISAGMDQATRSSASDFMFDKPSFASRLIAAMRQVAAAALDTAGTEFMKEVGKDDPWKYPPQQALEFLAGRENKMKGVADSIFERIKEQISEGITSGDSTEGMARRIRGEFNDISAGRARVVASTETSACYGSARDKAMLDAGVRWKQWLTSGLDNVRAEHEAANGQTVPVDEPFRVGGESLEYPGDPDGEPGNVINCHCVAIAANEP